MAPRQRSSQQASSDEAREFGELKSVLMKEVQTEFGDDRKTKKIASEAIGRIAKCLGDRIGSIQDVIDWVSFYKEDEIERIIFRWLSKDLDLTEVLAMKAASTITRFVILKEDELRKLHPDAKQKPRIEHESALGKDFDRSPNSFCKGMSRRRPRVENAVQHGSHRVVDDEDEIVFVEEIRRPNVPAPRARYSKLTMTNLKILHDHDYTSEPLDVPEHFIVARHHVDEEPDPIEYPKPLIVDPELDGSVEEIPVQYSSSERSSSGVF